MDHETVRQSMEAEIERVRGSALNRAFCWSLEVTDTTVFVGMRSRRNGERTHLLRATFDDFPRRAPSCVFVEEGSRQHGDVAWPPGVKHGSKPDGICTPGTREFHEHYHVNDRKYEWDPARFTFLSTLAEINRLLERGK